MKRKNWLLIISMILVDQIIKLIVVSKFSNESIELIKGALNLTYVENTGGAYGIGAANIIVIIGLNVLIIAMLIKLLYESENKDFTLGISLALAGGISNLIDRILRGFVVDYIDINQIIKYPVFNIADILIVIGIIISVIYIIKYSIQKQENDENEGI